MPARVSQESKPPAVTNLAIDNSLQHFTDTTFDPVSFLNDCLPSLSLSSTLPTDQIRSKESSLQDVSTRTQSFLTKLNAQNIRFAGNLSHLTDEILRSGSRLAYEVEVLRGDANALHESLTHTLAEDIQKFTLADTAAEGKDASSGDEQPEGRTDGCEPDFIGQLRMLGQVKARLEEVINVFGEAMKWPLSPSELSLTSSLISVSAPEPGSEGHSREEKGKEFAKKVRAEIVELLSNTAGGPDTEAAATKVDALRLLSTVWKGTLEERARNKLVDSLSKLVEDKRKQMEAQSLSQPPRSTDGTAQRSSSTTGRPSTGLARDRPGNETASGGGGLFRNLQRLRDEIYLD
jgi:hypothetical protein